MSMEAAQTETSKSHKSHKSKDSSSKKSAQKRQREEQHVPETSSTLDTESPSKKRRTSKAIPQSKPDAGEPETEDLSSALPTKASLPKHTFTQTIPDSYLTSHSPFATQTTSLYLALSPICHDFALQGLCAEHLSPLLLTYYPPIRGVVLSYSNPRLSESPYSAPSAPSSTRQRNASTTDRDSDSASDSDEELAAQHGGSGEEKAPVVLAKAIDEYAVNFIWLTADFLILRPARGTWIEGHVNLQNESYLGVVCWNFFNAGIERKRLPTDWTWISEDETVNGHGEANEEIEEEERVRQEMTGEGYFVDGSGTKVEGLIRFRVRDFESAPSTERDRGYIAIEGTLLSEEEDAKLDDEIRDKMRGKTKSKKMSRDSRVAPL